MAAISTGDRELNSADVGNDDDSARPSPSTTLTGSNTDSDQSIHLCVILHGLWGSPAHVSYIKESLVAHHDSDAAAKNSSETKLAVYVSSANSTSSGHLYDGIDVCAERVIEEIDAEIERLEGEQGAAGKITKFSIVGYSLGGLVARYVLGLLDSRSPSFFATVRPVNFTTFASPAIGMPQFDGYWASWFRYLGSRLLSRTGQQIHERDSFLSRDFVIGRTSGTSTPAGKARATAQEQEGEPLLKIMADPRFSFYRALCRFQRVEVYANTLNDRSVPFCTAALEAHDPFALACKRAIEAAEDAGESVDGVPDLAKGGLEVTYRPGTPILESYHVSEPEEAATLVTAGAAGAVVAQQTRRKRMRFSLPPPFRPSTYPVSKPKALVVISLLPVIWPVAISFLATRSLVHARQSQGRIRLAQSKIEGGVDGWLARVGIKLEELVERSALDEPGFADALDHFRERDAGQQATSSAEDQEDEAGVAREADEDLVPVPTEEEAILPPPAPRHSTSSSSSLSSGWTLAHGENAQTALLAQDKREKSTLKKYRMRDPRPSTDPVLSDSQLFQLEHLNAIPQLRKHLVHLPEVHWSHGAIIRRDPNFKQHEKGKLVVDTWASEFVL